jgi:mRNA-degrading endonuclease RelE of RelBE toxin-antitoxin system
VKDATAMARYIVALSQAAEQDLAYYRAYERKIILEGAVTQLCDDPDKETNDRKLLRSNPIAPWELRIGKYRVFYAVELHEALVVIVSIGHKDHNQLYIRGKVVRI